VSIEMQAESMRLLRRMRDQPEHPHELPDQLVAWASSNSLSRIDMAAALEAPVNRVDEIIRHTAIRDQNMKARALTAQAARHLPPELRQLAYQ
jgi:hypothetical protein